jgi:hypothetical protein
MSFVVLPLFFDTGVSFTRSGLVAILGLWIVRIGLFRAGLILAQEWNPGARRRFRYPAQRAGPVTT